MQKTGFLKEDSHIAQLPRHAHDLSASFGYTSSTGMILPVYQDFLNAGDTDYYSGELFTRLQPLVTQAMVDVDFYVDWFFVPMTMILNTWQNVRWQTRDFLSSAYAQTARSFFQGQLPLYDIFSYTCCDNGGQWDPNRNEFGTNFYFDCQGKSNFRMLNHLGFNPYSVFSDSTANPNYDDNNLPKRDNPNVFPMFALAYQAIWYDYFRIDDRSERLINHFNADAYYTRALSNPIQAGSGLQNPFQLQYRPYKDDYFTGVQASPMTSSVNLLGGFTSGGYNQTPAYVLSRLQNYLGTLTSPENVPGTTDSYAFPTPQGAIYTGGVGDEGDTFTNITPTTGTPANQSPSAHLLYGNLSTANIRQMFAVEKLMRITGKAAKNYDAQMLAHFGVKIPHDVKHELTHLGCDKGILHVGQVISTSDTFTGTSGSALGSLSGVGYVYIKGKKRKFQAPVDGIIMAVTSAVPRMYYYGTFDKQNAVTSRLDFYIPEYDRLGKQPLYAFEQNVSMIGSSDRVGWQWRYNQWKRKFSRVSEAFRQPRNNTSVNQYMPWVNGSKPLHDVNMTAGNFFDYHLYCTPHELDNCMVVPYTSTWNAAYNTTPWLMFATDPFINNFSANVKKVSIMSPTGEPLLD